MQLHSPPCALRDKLIKTNIIQEIRVEDYRTMELSPEFHYDY